MSGYTGSPAHVMAAGACAYESAQAVLVEDGRALAWVRPNKTGGEELFFPGGTVSLGDVEDAADSADAVAATLVRKVSEETGLDLEAAALRAGVDARVYTGAGKTVTGYDVVWVAVRVQNVDARPVRLDRVEWCAATGGLHGFFQGPDGAERSLPMRKFVALSWDGAVRGLLVSHAPRTAVVDV